MTTATLQERLAREPQLPQKEAVRIGALLAREVERLNRQGKRACPISPESVILRGPDVALNEGGPSAFPAPEEVAGQPVDERTDVYRLGALMYQMLTGSPPPVPEAPAKIATAPRLRPPASVPSVHAIRRDVNRALDAAISRALARNPRDRFARAGHFAEILDDALSGRLDHQPHSDRPSQMMIVDSWEFQEEEKRAERKLKRRATDRWALLFLLALAAILGFVLLR